MRLSSGKPGSHEEAPITFYLTVSKMHTPGQVGQV